MIVGILTGGGDAPGFNAVIYGALLKAYQSGIEVVGIKKGWQVFTYKNEDLTPQVVEKYIQKLDIGELDDLHTKGGTIIYTSRSNPFKALAKISDPKKKETKRIEIGMEMASKFEILGIDALIATGGDDTCGVASAMFEASQAKICACPKTVDNDIAGTDFTFGFFSAAQLAANALENLTTTAHSHQRIFIVEIMGRDAGWLTLYSGLSSGSDIILLPETPFDFNNDIVNVLKNRVNVGHKYHIIACSEGAYPTKESLERDFTVINQNDIDNLPKDAFGNPDLPKLGLADKIGQELKKRTDLKEYFEKCDTNYEIRSVVLGHTMRAGAPNLFDRILGLRYGFQAMDYIVKGIYGKMTALRGTEIVPVDLAEGAKKGIININSDLLEIKNAMTLVKQKSREKLFK